MNLSFRQNPHRHWIVAVLAGLLLVLLLMYWPFQPSKFFSGLRHSGASTSMEMVDLDLKTLVYAKNKVVPEEVPARWLMRLPRAYIVNMNLQSGTLDTGEGNSTFVGMNLRYHSANNELQPASLSKATSKGFISLQMTTGAGFVALGPDIGKCIPQDLFHEFQQQLKIPSGYKKPCELNGIYCQIVTDLDEWQIKLTVGIDMYKDHELTCQLVKDFLNKHTVSRNQRFIN